MEIRIYELTDTEFIPKAIITKFSEVTYKEHIRRPSFFTIKISLDDPDAREFQKNRLILIIDENRIDVYSGIIEDLYRTADQNLHELTVTGRDLKGLLDRRISLPKDAFLNSTKERLQNIDIKNNSESCIKYFWRHSTAENALSARQYSFVDIQPNLNRGIQNDNYSTLFGSIGKITSDLAESGNLIVIAKVIKEETDNEVFRFVFDVKEPRDKTAIREDDPHEIIKEPVVISIENKTALLLDNATETSAERNAFYASRKSPFFEGIFLSAYVYRENEDEGEPNDIERYEQHLSINVPVPPEMEDWLKSLERSLDQAEKKLIEHKAQLDSRESKLRLLDLTSEEREKIGAEIAGIFLLVIAWDNEVKRLRSAIAVYKIEIEEYLLTELGNQATRNMSEYMPLDWITGKINFTNLVRSRDYELGDYVTVQNREWNIERDVQITEIETRAAHGDITVSVIFDDGKKSVAETLERDIFNSVGTNIGGSGSGSGTAGGGGGSITHDDIDGAVGAHNINLTAHNDIRQLIGKKYEKPTTGIPKTDMSGEVQNSLNLANTALQSFTETDPVYTKDKPSIALKIDITNHNTSSASHADIRAILNKFVGIPEWDDDNYIIKFKAYDGSTLEIDLPLEALTEDIGYDPVTKEIILTKKDGTEIRVNVSDLIDVYLGSTGTHIQVDIDSNNVIRAVLRAGSITETELSSALVTKLNGKADTSSLGALAFKDTITNADVATNAAIAQSKIALTGNLSSLAGNNAATGVLKKTGASTVGASLITNADISDGSITKTKLDTSVQTSLDKADTALQSVPDITLTDAAASTTLPTTASGTITSKIQALRDNVKALFSYFTNGIANTAAKLQTPRTFNVSGEVTGTAQNFDGQGNVTIPTVLQNVTRTNTTSTESPNAGGTFTALDGVTTDQKGRVTGTNTKTVTMPPAVDISGKQDINITLTDAAGSTTLPTMASGTITSKIQALRDNVKALFSYFSAGVANVAAKLNVARTLKVNLASTADVTFDGSANQTGIGVLGVLPVANGGTNAATVAGESSTQRRVFASPKSATAAAPSFAALDKSDVGLGNVDNTSDASKPISSAVQAALNGKESTVHNIYTVTNLTTGHRIKTDIPSTTIGSLIINFKGDCYTTVGLFDTEVHAWLGTNAITANSLQTLANLHKIVYNE